MYEGYTLVGFSEFEFPAQNSSVNDNVIIGGKRQILQSGEKCIILSHLKTMQFRPI